TEISIRIDNPSKSGLDRFVGLEHFISGELVIRNWGSTENLVSAMKVCKAGDVLLARRNVYLKRASMVDFDGLCSGDAIVLREKHGKLIPGFLSFVLNTNQFWEYANANADGSMSKRINVKTLMKYEFLLPPIEDQRRISELLWSADALMEKYKKNVSCFQEIQKKFTQEFDIVLSQDINIVSFSDCVDFASGQVDPKNEPYASMPLIAPNHIESGTGQVIEIETARQQNAISGKYLFHKGQVVYSKIRPALKKAFIASCDGLCSADMYPLIPKDDKLSTEFLLRILLSPRFSEYATNCSVRTSIPKLNRKDMGAFKLHLPSTEYQNSFMEKYNALEKEKYATIDQITRT
ncbi:MAG: restriction endonuclease subunit S, partial [Bacillota bacterium]